VDVFDRTSSSLLWKNKTHLHDMPVERRCASAVVLKKTYLAVIGGNDQDWNVTASCLIFDFSSNRWSSTPASIDMIKFRISHAAAVLDDKIVVAGGEGQDENTLKSVECIDVHALLEYTPLHYPLPDRILDRVFEIGKVERELVRCTVIDKVQ